jgi:hypothetical protein
MFLADVPTPAPNALYTLAIGGDDLFTIFTLDAGNPTQAAADATAVLASAVSRNCPYMHDKVKPSPLMGRVGWG